MPIAWERSLQCKLDLLGELRIIVAYNMSPCRIA
jgi:hypothetical protein